MIVAMKQANEEWRVRHERFANIVLAAAGSIPIGVFMIVAMKKLNEESRVRHERFAT